ncbi:methyltransferase domain-containing protein [Actinospica durhamensis]|uniref:Methyltransferase domain-containing protein n=1 Tax=Actinospica durhamensis TaxID=1508375 RepID=A0A941ILP5_9ACTN|nr:class I SAM-dependent methyltransferase [Actinospica durhamensis]MBR7831959.1 methyltransferase domain-containing protein [Actinospica durhamensis]
MYINCRVCGGNVQEFVDLGRQTMANGFLRPEDVEREYFFRLAVGMCELCTMVQLLEEVPQHLRYHDAYRYHASGSESHRKHFAQNARRFMESELTGPDPFIVEIGCNDGVMLSTIAQAGVRHLGVEPAGNVAELAKAKGVQVLSEFFDLATATEIRAEHGRADVIFGANTICHIADIESLLLGVDVLLGPDGVFVFEEPYLGTIVGRTAFDQIYDEHIFYFTVRSVQAMADRFGLELVDVERIPLHGGEIRYTLARPSKRTPTPAVGDLLAAERTRGLAEPETFERFGHDVERVRGDLVTLLREIRAEGRRVVGYGAPGKCTTVTNYCEIGPDLVPFICDSTPSKQGHLVSGSHIPVRPPEAFAHDYPDFALLFAWNHAEEIMTKEKAFRDAGGKWILYVPDVHIIG